MLAIHVELYRNSFHGLRDTGEPDWPPSPRRLLGALIAGAHTLPDKGSRDKALNALQRVAESPPPVIDAPEHIPLGLPGTYSPATWLPDEQSKGGITKFVDLSLLGMDTHNRVLKPQDGLALSGHTITFYVDVASADDAVALDNAACKVPYFGTSRDPADLSVAAIDGDLSSVQPHLARWYPSPSAYGETHGWLAVTFDWFEANYQRVFGQDADVAALQPIPAEGYVQPLDYDTRRQVSRTRLAVAPLARSVPNRRIPEFAGPLNGEVETELPGWRVFPLTVSHESEDPRTIGDGRCVGFALVALTPRDRPPDDLFTAEEVLTNALLRLPEPESGLAVGRSAALNPRTWAGPSETWYSTTPLRAFPDKRVVQYQLAEELRERYGATLTELHLQRTPRIRRNGRWSNGALADGLDQWWAELTLSEQVEGPLLLGAATDRGFGAFRPRQPQE